MKYTGQTKNKLPYGFGKLEMKNGDLYEGQFIDGKFNGNGTYTFKNGNKYVGNFKNHLYHDQGKIVYTSGKTIFAQFYNGKAMGKVKVQSKSGTCEGKVLNGKFEGEINFEKKDQKHSITFKGFIINQKPDEFGSVTVGEKNKKCTYNGQWNQGKRTGNGELDCSNGKKFSGEWVENNFRKGILIKSNGDSYEGSFLNGEFSGEGKYTDNNGSTFQCSNWMSNKPFGMVKIQIYNGNEYTGFLENGIPNGKGIIKFKNWFAYLGQWKNGSFEGMGNLFFPNDDSMIGNFKKGKMCGQGMFLGYVCDFQRESDLFSSASSQSSSPSSQLASLFSLLPPPALFEDTTSPSTSSSPSSSTGTNYKIMLNGTWTGLRGSGQISCVKSTNSALLTELEKEKEKKMVGKKTKEVGKVEGEKKGKKDEAKTGAAGKVCEKMLELQHTPTMGGWVLSHAHILYTTHNSSTEKEKINKGKKNSKASKAQSALSVSLSGPSLPDSLDNLSSTCVLREDGFRDEKRIGSGGFGEVFSAKYFGGSVAYKKLDHKLGKAIVEDFTREVMTMSRLRHPNIICFWGYTPEPNLRMVMEYASGGTLHDLIHANPLYATGIPAHVFLDAACQVAAGMAYLSSERIIHKDLKPMNVLIDVNSIGDRTYKIADFGLSKLRQHEQTVLFTKGTPQYSPPEAFSEELCTDRVDVYSYGIMLWELWTREIPFAKLSFSQVCGSVFRNERPRMPAVPANAPYLSKYASLVEQCWQQQPDKRPSFAEVLDAITTIAAEERAYGK